MFRNREIFFNTIFAAVFTIAAFVLCFSISRPAAIVALAGCIGVYAVCMFFTACRYRKLAELANYLQKVSTGGAAMDIRENAEGELSILKNEIYRVTMALTEQADALQKDKVELANALSDISHQLKTPLTSLGIMADLLENESLPPEKRREFVSAIRTGQNRMEWLILSLLKLAKLDADAVLLKKETISLASLIKRASDSLLISLEVKEQTFSVKGNDTDISCDPDWTVEALGNILKNAVENTPLGGRIEVTYGKNSLYAFVTVRDSGPGIDGTDLPYLFKRFYRGKNAGPDSVGIGLSMSLAIMQKQNGDIEAAVDNGGVFTLKFYHLK